MVGQRFDFQQKSIVESWSGFRWLWSPVSFSFFLFSILISGCTDSGSGTENPLLDPEWIDLTHPFEESTHYWPNADGFKLDTLFQGMTDQDYYYSAFAFSGAEHGGTHLDAPIHFAQGKPAADEIPLDHLTGYSIVVDVRDSASVNRDYQVKVEDFENWEVQHGKIPTGAIVLILTGHDQYWGNAAEYMGTAARGDSATAHLHFPGIHPDAARWLVENRSIKAIGLDTPSIDYGPSPDFESHRIFCEEEIPGFENLTRLDQLSPQGDYVIALPMKIKGGSGGPLRIIALKSK